MRNAIAVFGGLAVGLVTFGILHALEANPVVVIGGCIATAGGFAYAVAERKTNGP